MEDIFYPSVDGKTTVHACVWRPEVTPRAVVQIIHGMCEYAERYTPFAEYLASQGYLVCAEDHAGHGKSARSADKRGWFNETHDYKLVLKDIHALRERISAECPNVPYFVLGHSMGSFFCRNYIAQYGEGLSGAVIMGTGFKGKALMNFALFAVKCNALFCGWDNRSNVIKGLGFGSYNNRFKAENDSKSWLSVNEENRRAYKADENCNFDFTNNGYYVLFSVIKAACSKKVISAIPKDLPVYFVAGSDDPVGDYGKGVKKSCDRFVKAGMKDVRMTIYENARHEILNDDCKDKVRSDILEFFNTNCN